MAPLKNDDAGILTTMQSCSSCCLDLGSLPMGQISAGGGIHCGTSVYIYIIYTHMPAQRRRERSTLSKRVRRQRQRRRNYVYVADRFYAPKSAPAEATTMGQPFSAQAFCFIAARATTAAVAAAAVAPAASSQSVCACALHRPAASQRAYCDRISGSRPCSLFCIVDNPSQTIVAILALYILIFDRLRSALVFSIHLILSHKIIIVKFRFRKLSNQTQDWARPAGGDKNRSIQQQIDRKL